MKKVLLFASCVTFISAQAQQSPVQVKETQTDFSEASPTANTTPIPSSKALWDVDFSFDATSEAGSSGQAGVAFVNNEFWTSRWQNDTIYRYSSTGTLLETFTISGLSGTRSITTDGTSLFMGNASTTIYEVDPVTKTVTSSFASSAGVNSRFLTYDSSLDGGNGGFWTGDFNTDIIAISMSGAVLSTIPAATHGLASMYGAAIDEGAAGGPILWVFHQEGANSTQMTAVSLSAGIPTGVTRDVYSDVSGTYSLTSGLAGGAFITTDYNGGKSLICMVQGTPSNVVVVYDGTYASLAENEMNEMTVYPVPANDVVNVSLENAFTETAAAQLYDMSGKLVRSQEVPAGASSFQMNVSGLDQGVYELSVKSNDLSIEKRIIVE